MKKLLIFTIAFVWALAVSAVPANRKPFVVKQSDGTMLSIVLQGDEALHFFTTLDGKYVVKDTNGDYCYATFSQDSGFLSTGIVAHEKEKRSDAENEFLAGIDIVAMDSAVVETHKTRSMKYKSSVATRASSTASLITTGEVLVPVLLVEYQDVKFSFKKEDIEKMFNEPGYKYEFSIGNVECFGSVRDYFIAQSEGLFSPRFVLTDILTLPNDMAYYGGNDSSGNDKNPQAMIRQGIELADETFDFSQFDNDGDGHVDFLYCIYAGYSEANRASSNTIWPHQWELTSNGSNKYVDGVYCNKYACSSELNITEEFEEYGKWLSGIGTVCHEYSHCLGLHDVYDVSKNSGNWGMDDWDLMGNGNFAAYGYIPVGYNSYQKDCCGWKSLEVLEKKGRYSMEAQSRGGVGYKIVNEANPNEYFILENRRCEGWDQTLAADGMMIIHVDYDKTAWKDNKINTTSGHPRFQIVPADNELMFYSDSDSQKFYENMAGDLWPGKNNNNKFTDTSLPAATVFTGGFLGKPVTNIKYENYVSSFNFMGGFVETPAVMSATDITNSSFVANWEEVDYATEFLVELYGINETDGDDGDVEILVEEDFLNCYKSATAIQDDMDTYMSVTGWTGQNIYSETGMLCIGSLNNPGTLSTPMLDATGSITVNLKVAKYNSNATAINLLVEVVDAQGNVITSENISSAGSFELKTNVAGKFFVRFSTAEESTNKRLLVDDISVITTLPYKKVLVESVKTETCTFLFDNLEPGGYFYRVRASDGDAESAFSEYVKVLLSETSALEIPSYDEKVTVYTLFGVKIHEGGMESLRNLHRGIYILKSSSGVKKFKIE